MTVYVTQPCVSCGERSEVTVDEYELARWKSGEHIQSVWPQQSADWRELLISGTHPACWERMFGSEQFVQVPEEPQECRFTDCRAPGAGQVEFDMALRDGSIEIRLWVCRTHMTLLLSSSEYSKYHFRPVEP